MKKIVFVSIISLIFLTSLYFFIQFLPKTSKGFWNSYFVFAVEKSVDKDTVFSFFEKLSISNYIHSNSLTYSFEDQKIPFALAYKNIQSLFFDESGNYQLFYIPIQYLNLFSQKNLIKPAFNYILDTHLKKNITVFILSLFIFFILISKTKQRAFFFFGGLPILIAAFFYCQFSFIALYISQLYLVFFISLSYKRKSFFQFFKSNIFTSLISLYFILSLFWSNTFFFVQALCISLLSLSTLGIYYFIEQAIESKKRFSPHFILSNIYKKEKAYTNIYTFLPFSLCFIVLIIISFFNLNFDMQTKVLRIPFPQQNAKKTDFSIEAYEKTIANTTKNAKNDAYRFPNLAFFIADSWNQKKAAYVSVYDENFYDKNQLHLAKAGDSVEFSHFIRSEEGIIQLEKQLYTFDNSFIASILEEIKESVSVENLLQSQNCFTEIVYEKTSKLIVENYLQLKLLFSWAFSLFLIAYFLNQKRKKLL